MTRKRSIKKKVLRPDELEVRGNYIEGILAINKEEVLLIPTDEIPIGFRGDTNYIHILAPAGVSVYLSLKDDSFTRI